MKNLINNLKATNKFSTGDLSMIHQMCQENHLKCVHLWIKSKAIPLLTSKYTKTLLLGHKLNDLAGSIQSTI